MHRYGKTRWAVALTLAVISSPAVTGCARQDEHTPSLRPEMHRVSETVSRLYFYVWRPAEFQAQEHEKEIQTLLKRLAREFHRVSALSGDRQQEPAFQAALRAQQELIEDVSVRFDAGAKDYAKWQLQGAAYNCISCHSLHRVQSSFMGDAPQPPGHSFESRLARARFLFASRQFEQASEELLTLADAAARNPKTADVALDALRLWLAIHVGLSYRPGHVHTELVRILKSAHLPASHREILRSWAGDSTRLAQNATSPARIEEALAFAANLETEARRERDDHLLVSLLAATSVLQRAVEMDPPPELRSRLLLGIGRMYRHLNLPEFRGLGPIFLEQLIREHPRTEEAQAAYLLLHRDLISESAGSEGVHLELEDLKRLEELRALAYGEDN